MPSGHLRGGSFCEHPPRELAGFLQGLSTLKERCAVIERSLGGVIDDLKARVDASDDREREDLRRLGKRFGQLELATGARTKPHAAPPQKGSSTA